MKLIKMQDSLEKILKNEKPRMGISTGLTDLDNAILGFRPEHLIIVAGYSGMGKSSIVTDFVLAAAKQVPVGFFSIEMGRNIITERAIYNVADLNYHRGVSGGLQMDDKLALKDAVQKIKELNSIYIDTEHTTIYPTWREEKDMPSNSIQLAIEQMIGCGVKAIFIDYVQIIEYGFKTESETLRLKNITNKLHRWSIDYKIPIIALSQLKKDVGDKKGRDTNHTPTLSDIRDGGFIINDADVVLLLDRPDYFNVEKEGLELFANKVEDARIIVAKQRSGPLGPINVKFNSYSMSWKDSSGGI